MDFTEVGIVVIDGVESLLVSGVKKKKKQDQYPILLDLKVNVHKKRVLDLEQGGDDVVTFHNVK